ncbi:MAG: XdhC family protein [Candidatus Tectimicrobiota bacterium]
MTMTPEFLQAIQNLIQTGTPAVRATLIKAQGFVPVPKNSALLLTATGQPLGSLGNAELDREVQHAARQALAAGQWRLQQFTVPAPDSAERGWYNGWVVDVLLEPLSAASHPFWQAVCNRLTAGQRGIVGTVLTEQAADTATPQKLLLSYDGSTYGTLGNAALEAYMTRRAQELWQGEQNVLETYQTSDGRTLQVFLEPVLPHPTLYVFGGGQIALPLVHLAALADFRPIVIDTQPAFANATRFPEASMTRVMEFAAIGSTFTFGPDDYLVLMTRGHQHDEDILAQIYDCQARYLGLLGSSRRAAALLQRLVDRGIPRHYLDRVHAPIGLSIGAVSPVEVALSIVAEMVRARRQHTALVPSA